MSGKDPSRPATPSELLHDLVTDLLRATLAGALTWQADDAHPTSYCTRSGAWMAAIRSVDGDNQQPYALVLLREGEALEATSVSAYALQFRDDFARLHVAAAASTSLRGPLLADVAAEVRALVPAEAPPRPSPSEPAEPGREGRGRRAGRSQQGRGPSLPAAPPSLL